MGEGRELISCHNQFRIIKMLILKTFEDGKKSIAQQTVSTKYYNNK